MGNKLITKVLETHLECCCAAGWFCGAQTAQTRRCSILNQRLFHHCGRISLTACLMLLLFTVFKVFLVCADRPALCSVSCSPCFDVWPCQKHSWCGLLWAWSFISFIYMVDTLQASVSSPVSVSLSLCAIIGAARVHVLGRRFWILIVLQRTGNKLRSALSKAIISLCVG